MKKYIAMLMCLAFAAARAEDAAPKVEADKPAAPPAAAPAEKPAPKPAPKFLVILPEEVDGIWYWSYFTTESEHIVQSAVEKGLVEAGLDVIDLSTLKMKSDGSLDALMNTSSAAEKAKEAGAAYVIVGKATAVNGGTSVAYGVPVARASATLTAKIVRVSDGKVLAVKDADATDGGQSIRVAGQSALKKAGSDLADALVSAAKKIAEQ